MNYEVKIDKFSGPLEKLLELIEEKQLDVTLVSLAKVTGDFLDYLKNLADHEKHPSVLADFVVVASRLLLIKSKAILPSLELTEEEETDIKDLESRLKIYKEFKDASQLLNKFWDTRRSSYGRELFMHLPPVFYPSKNLTVQALENHLLELIQELKALVPEKQTIKKIFITIEQKVKELLGRLQEKSEQSFRELAKEKSRLEIIMIFLAILHLIRDRLVKSEQTEKFSDITISKVNNESGIMNQEQ